MRDPHRLTEQAREQAAREQAAREQAVREQAALDRAAREKAVREQAARDAACEGDRSSMRLGDGAHDGAVSDPDGSSVKLRDDAFSGGHGSADGSGMRLGSAADGGTSGSLATGVRCTCGAVKQAAREQARGSERTASLGRAQHTGVSWAEPASSPAENGKWHAGDMRTARKSEH
jgi:hypothetical protein